MIAFSLRVLGGINSVSHFATALFKFRHSIANRKIWYRGQSNASHGLLPTIARPHSYAGRRTKRFNACQEQQLLHRFRRRSYPHIGRSLTAGEALFLARHHKLPTRLLDWSANAMVGLYFACIADPKTDGTLWGAVRRKESKDLDAFDLAKQEREKDLFAFLGQHKPSVKLIHPFYNSPRMLAQDGAFTVHNDPWRKLESYVGELFMPEALDIEQILQWRIARAAKTRIIEELSGLGITHRTVYPDLDGIAQSLWETEVLWGNGNAGS